MCSRTFSPWTVQLSVVRFWMHSTILQHLAIQYDAWEKRGNKKKKEGFEHSELKRIRVMTTFTSAMVAKDLELFGITNNNVRASNNTDKSVLAGAWYVKLDFLERINNANSQIYTYIYVCKLYYILDHGNGNIFFPPDIVAALSRQINICGFRRSCRLDAFLRQIQWPTESRMVCASWY